MVAYSIFLNFVEVFTLTAFVYLYYSFSSRKQFCLLLASLFLICELCDIFKENGFVLLVSYFIISCSFIILGKHKIQFGDMFILGGYLFLMINYPYISYCLYNKILDAGYETVYYICAGITSKLFLILVTCWLLRHLKFTFPVPNKQYSLVIITEVVILSIFGMISYDNVEVTASYSPVIIDYFYSYHY